MADKDDLGSYASVNGLNIYYEIHGTGRPLVLLAGGFMTIEAMGKVLSPLSSSRQVIAVELQGHGHTADVDRPLSFELMADDQESNIIGSSLVQNKRMMLLSASVQFAPGME